MLNTPQVFREVELGELLPEVQKYKNAGWRFSQLCGSTIEGGVEIVYTFAMGSGEQYENLILNIENGTHVPSITGYFGVAFIFENELHDLYGVPVDGISIDYKGQMYRIAVGTPMNPEAAKFVEEAVAPGKELVEELMEAAGEDAPAESGDAAEAASAPAEAPTEAAPAADAPAASVEEGDEAR